ncbi:DNA-binding protein [uncultured Nocardioides sp.]|uniref:DNA-binding protein n=1 Tax=uncultured Nocardioides sp. TaxID=198441 RepID=UPI00260C9FCA|nr:DNA-binding protein [uncultured Nocardioides sp.]
MDEARLRDNLAEQTALYGAGVGELLAGVTRPLGLSQAAVARILGLSPAMLSQLVTGHRVRIGNPRVLHRLRLLLDLAEESPRLTRRTLAGRLAEIGRANADLTTRERPVTAATTVTARTPAETLTALLRAAASPEELDRAAAALDDVAPGVAALLRAHGPGAPERPLTR